MTEAAIKAVVGEILGSMFWNFLQKSSGASTIGGPAPINFDQATNPDNPAQAPGIPTEKDGFEPDKNWEGKKEQHPKTGQWRWKDKKGDILGTNWSWAKRTW